MAKKGPGPWGKKGRADTVKMLPTLKTFLAEGIKDVIICTLCNKSFTGKQGLRSFNNHKQLANHSGKIAAKISRYTQSRPHFDSSCITKYFTEGANNECPECEVELFTPPRKPNFKTGPSSGMSAFDVDDFPDIAEEFLRTLWHEVATLYNEDDIFEADIEEKIQKAISDVQYSGEQLYIGRKQFNAIVELAKEMIKDQFEHHDNHEQDVNDAFVSEVWFPKLATALEQT